MWKLGDFRIGSDDNWFFITRKDGTVIRRFRIEKYEIWEVRMYREGYVKGLNAQQGD